MNSSDRRDRRRRLGNGAGAGRCERRARNPAVGARARGGRGHQCRPRKPRVPAGRSARSRDPRDRRPWPILEAATPGWSSRRRNTCARARSGAAGRACRWCSVPRASRSAAASSFTRSRAELCPDARLAVLSGPTFAHEVATGLPTAVTLAAEDLRLGERLARSPRAARVPSLCVGRCRRRRDRRRGQERAGDRLRRRRGPRARPERARRADRARLCRDDPLRRLRGGPTAKPSPACPDSAISFSPAPRPARATIRLARASARAGRRPSCSRTSARLRKGLSPRRCWPGSRPTQESTCRSSRRSPISSRAAAAWRRCSKRCWRGRRRSRQSRNRPRCPSFPSRRSASGRAFAPPRQAALPVHSAQASAPAARD